MPHIYKKIATPIVTHKRLYAEFLTVADAIPLPM